MNNIKAMRLRYKNTNSMVSKILTAVNDAISKEDDKIFFVFGANNFGESIIEYLKDTDKQIFGIVDNKVEYQGNKFCGLPVESPENFLLPFNDNFRIFIQSQYYEEMISQLKDMGYIEDKHIIKTINLAKNDKTISSEILELYGKSIKRGFNIYNQIITDQNEMLFIVPLLPNGDMYILCSYLEEYLEKNSINKATITVLTNTLVKIVELFFPLGNDKLRVIKVSEEDSDDLCALAFLFPRKIEILQPHFRDLNLINYDGYKGISFLDHYKKLIFGLDGNTKPFHPPFNQDATKVDEFFEKYSLRQGKTILLAPYANSIFPFKTNIWEKIAERLKKLGYDVVTNSSSESEPPVQGTLGVFFEFKNMVPILNKCKAMISFRSGFCELAASAKCIKIFICPDIMVQHMSVKDFHSDEEYFNGALEYIVTKENEDYVIEEIIKEIHGD
ncbi:MAG: hypothetical protein GX219_08610 [Tissierellia bacterium]|nr:hypothetical protein [Tissierellia bacterium]